MHSARLARAPTLWPLGRLLPAMLLAVGLLASVTATQAAQPRVVVLPVTGVVDQVMAGYIRDGIGRAASEGAAAVLIRLDTPGGSVDSTREIVKSLLEARVPTIVWVAPAGSRAASAGTFITLAANIALMAPGTNIGAATPVGGQGEDIQGALGQKAMNDAVAMITSIAQERGRPVDWAVETVRKARSSDVDEAVRLRVVDAKVATLDEVLRFADGRTVTVGGRPAILELTGATTDEKPMNPLQSFLHLLADPNIAFILLTVGFYGLLYEVINPNFVTGILGAMALILGFIGLGSLPLNVGGLLLIGLAILLFVLELTVTSHGLLTVAGLVCFVLGASALYTEPGPTTPDVRVAPLLILVMSGATAAFLGLVATAALRTRRMPAMALGLGGGSGGVLAAGTPAEVRRPLDPLGSVYA
ncbi:MAG: nodulation protein NfeD, partial [Chloroflexota bacterium]|nr:nodulation protein NfeD [Chloroflexota bacterium]